MARIFTPIYDVEIVSSPQEQQCKGCGLLVQKGYARCPRCTMPQAQIRPSKEATQVQGGTIVEGSSSMRSTLVAGALLLGLLLVVLMAGDDDKKDTPVTESQADAQEEERAGLAEPLEEQTEQPIGINESDFADNSEQSRERALTKFTEALAVNRLWASVDGEPEGSSVDIISASCSDPAMKPSIAGASDLLHAVDIRHLRCLEKHGALVFEQDL